MAKKLLLVLMLACGTYPLLAQTKTVTGVVTQDGIPLAGVNVLLQGTATGTQTDFDGLYTIEASSGDVLVFSYIGMKSQSLTVGATDKLDVALEEDAE